MLPDYTCDMYIDFHFKYTFIDLLALTYDKYVEITYNVRIYILVASEEGG